MRRGFIILKFIKVRQFLPKYITSFLKNIKFVTPTAPPPLCLTITSRCHCKKKLSASGASNGGTIKGEEDRGPNFKAAAQDIQN
jgi:hypothetical protein